MDRGDARRASRSGPIPINVNFRYVSDELAYIFDNADLVGLVFDDQYAPLVTEIRDKAPRLKAFVHVDTGIGDTGADVSADLDALGSVAYEDATAGQSPDRDGLPDAAPPTTSTSSTPAAPPACPRA